MYAPFRGLRRPAPLFLAAAAALAPALTAAQEPDLDRQERTEREERCICFDDVAPRAMTVFGSRAQLGVFLGEDTRVAGRPGVRLADVPERSPAWRAGLRARDVVVAVDGQELGEDPGAALREAMADHEPGDEVRVSYIRDGRESTATVVTEERSAPFVFRGGAPDARGFELRVPGGEVRGLRLPGRDGSGAFWFGGASGLELAAVNPELGAYFGTDRGVLVVAVEAPGYGLRPGDVLLAIDGRELRDPGHARSILASYADGEPITFQVVREQRTREVTGEAPGR